MSEVGGERGSETSAAGALCGYGAEESEGRARVGQEGSEGQQKERRMDGRMRAIKGSPAGAGETEESSSGE